jgi:hypothetical protein
MNVEEWSKTVNGLGPIITNKVKEVISTPYEESKQQQLQTSKSLLRQRNCEDSKASNP